MFRITCFFTLISLSILLGSGFSRHVVSRIRHQDPELRIINGDFTDEASRPREMVGLETIEYINSTHLYKGRCGGTLLSVNYVLTAAHCLTDVDEVTAIVGTTRYTSTIQYHRIPAQSWEQHANYRRSSHYYDIGVVRLANPVNTQHVSVGFVKLPPSNLSADAYTDQLVKAYGWGDVARNGPTSDLLKEVTVKVINSTECKSLMQSYSLSFTDNDICTENKYVNIPHTRAGTCHGDSGGPLYFNGTQIGITSYGDSDCLLGAPDLYVNVTQYLTWIEAHSDVILDK